MNSPSRPEIKATTDGYELTWEKERVIAQVTRLSDHSDGLVAEVEISTMREPRPGLLKWGRLDLMAEQTRSRWASSLEKRDMDLDWAGMLEQLCREVRDAHRAGTPAIDLREVPLPTATRWLVEPFVELGGVTVLFAMGGTGKSMLSLAIATTAASGVPIVGKPHDHGPVLYLDWETDAPTAKERLHAIAWGAQIPSLPPIHYRRQVASLDSAITEIRRDVARLGARMVVIDSLGAARGGEPESADLTIRTFVAIRSLGVPALVVDHVAKAQGNDATTSFGSVFTHNLARLTWALDKAQEEGSGRSVLALVNRKRNNGRVLPRMGLEMATESDDNGNLIAVRFKDNIDLTKTDLYSKASVRDRIKSAIKTGGRTAKELADEIGAPLDQVHARVKSLKDAGEVLVDSEHRVWMAALEN